MRLRGIVGVAAAVSAGALVLPMTAAVASPLPSTDGLSSEGSLVERISEAATDGIADLGALSVAVGLPETGPSSLMGEGGDLSVTVSFASAPTEAQIAAVSAIGSVEQVYTIAPAVLVAVDPSRVDELSPLDGVVSVRPVLEPTNGSQLRESASAATLPSVNPAALPVDSCRSIPVEADGPLLSAEARAKFGVDGTGVTVGIISDSYGALSTPTSPAMDVASGVLPGPGNPCGYETPVEVLSDYAAADEGRGMAQLIHGIAPGAKLMFATGWGGGSLGMAQAVSDLAAAGATIIVDDLGYGDELAFQHGVLSTVISSVRASGIAYYTAAGNGTTVGEEGTSSAGLPLNGWMTPEFRSMPCPSWVVPYTGLTSYDCLDWSPTGAGEASDSFGFNGLRQLQFNIQWGEPEFGVTTGFEAQIYKKTPGVKTLVTVGGTNDGTLPIMVTAVPTSLGAGEYELVLIRNTATPDTKPAISIGIFGDARGMTWREHDRSVGQDKAGFSAWGHAGDGSGVSVAASNWETPYTPEDFSSLGPNLLIFEPVLPGASTPSARLPEPVLVSSPVITSVDGTQTSFFGRPEVVDGVTEYRFSGTSAAAPNAAAVHALAAQFAPTASAEDIVQTMYATAQDMTNPYAGAAPDEWVFGAGLVNASALLAALETPTPTPTPTTTDGASTPAATATLAATGLSVPPALLLLGAGVFLSGLVVLVARRRRVS